MIVLKGIVKEVPMIFVATWLVLLSLLIPKKVDNRAELAQVELG